MVSCGYLNLRGSAVNEPLNDRRQRILQRVAAGEGWREAARAEGCTDSYSRVVGARMKRNPAVAKAIAEIREAGMKAAVYDLALAMKEAEEVIEFAKKHKHPTAYFFAVRHRAHLSGLLVERVEIATVDLRASIDGARDRVLKVIDQAQRTALSGPSVPVTTKDTSVGYRGPGEIGDPFAEQ
jgi:hypothetical protein